MTETETLNEDVPVKRGRNKSNLGFFILSMVIIILLAGFGYGYFQLSKVNVSLAKMVSSLKNQAEDNQANLAALGKTITNLQQIVQKSQDYASQQEQVMNQLRSAQQGDLDKWRVAEALYLVKLANNHLAFAHDAKMAQLMLEQANASLQMSQNNQVMEIRRSISNALENLQGFTNVDVTNIYLQLSALDKQVNELPLPSVPLKAENPSLVNPPSTDSSWWKSGLQQSWQALQQIVVVKHIGLNTMPFVMPEEKGFLYLNIHAQLSTAMWAVLHNNADVYQDSLAQITTWIKQYTVQDAALTQTFLQKLQELQKTNIKPETPNLAMTLQLFDNYFAQAKTAASQPAVEPKVSPPTADTNTSTPTAETKVTP